MKPFDVKNINLQGNNLIEASAGTGKTYSIGILVLRLLLEKGIRIEQILMVTFTNAAVAELEIRIRQFLREAFLIVRVDVPPSGGREASSAKDTTTKTKEKVDPTILDIVNRAIKDKSQKEVQKVLSEAILFLDETSIFTIHSFCQLTLSEFAFETKQMFNSELIEDQSSIIEDAVNDFWRKEITILNIKILGLLAEKGFSRDILNDFSKEIFSGKKLKVRNTIDSKNIVNELVKFQDLITIKEKEYQNEIEVQWQRIIEIKLSKSTTLFKARENEPKENFGKILFDLFYKKTRPKYIDNLDFLFPFIESIGEEKKLFEAYKIDVLINFLSQVEKHVKKEVEKKKNRNQVLSFHDLIAKLHSVLVKENNFDLKQKLCKKYKAVFIDEFQDTDRLQYEIFRHAFIDNCDSAVFFIGDPKQSIYAWRGADLKTYIKAQEDIGDNKFTMKNNFRSTEELINSMNDFFPKGTSCHPEHIGQSNPFCSEKIKYEHVESGNKTLSNFSYKNESATALDIINHQKGNDKIDDLLDAAGREVVDLLKNYYFELNGKKTKIFPKDIGILVRQRKQAKQMKDILSKYNIPAIVIDETKVIDTDEARDLYYLVYAIKNLDASSISRALFTVFTSFNTEQVSKQNLDFHKKYFMELKENWKNSGIYSAIVNFVSKYNIRQNLLDNNNPKGNRIYSNLMQLAEILNEKEIYDNYTPEKLLDWFQKAREGLDSNNKYEQRIESDEDAIQIATIHKSKGLQYNIVVLPLLNLKPRSVAKDSFITYLEDDGFSISYHKTDEEIELNRFQEEQENRRLLYVAITRAVYKCIIHYDNKTGSLHSFIDNIDVSNTTINIREPLASTDFNYSIIKTKQFNYTSIPFSKKISDIWRLTSYSALDTHEYIQSNQKEPYFEKENEYDKFIFDYLQKGVQTGIILHSIFEKIDFASNKNWNNIVEQKIQLSDVELSEIEKYNQLIVNVINAKLAPLDFNLSKVQYNKRFNELEFFFSFAKWDGSEIKKLLKNFDISSSKIKGVMHGFIDLLFEYEGKYYILDWKSNHLGYNIEDYSFDNLEEAMTSSNYHLQYIIYTIAVKRFLENHLNDFDYDKHFGGVLYLFLRGMREGKDTGIYYKKPNKELVEKLDVLIS